MNEIGLRELCSVCLCSSQIIERTATGSSMSQDLKLISEMRSRIGRRGCVLPTITLMGVGIEVILFSLCSFWLYFCCSFPVFCGLLGGFFFKISVFDVSSVFLKVSLFNLFNGCSKYYIIFT